MKLIHGGQLHTIAQHYAIPIDEWLDLSTGISPISYPVPPIPISVWQQLPQSSPTLLKAAQQYYKTDNLIATSGSQSIIETLPSIFIQHIVPTTTVWLPKVGYKEHEKAWHDHGFIINHYSQLPSADELTPHCIVVVINPNNPTGVLTAQSTLTQLLTQVEKRQGWLIVDEAFMDCVTPSQSVASLTNNPHLFVLRSVGKFFGLAGIRLGFLSAAPIWLSTLANTTGPWQVNGPAQYIAEKALTDLNWQSEQSLQLQRLSNNLEHLLMDTFQTAVSGTSLFKTVLLPNAPELFKQLCQQGVYVRLCDEQNALRFGIPTDAELEKLAKAFAKLN
ncbi:threonine-phosphate decarboxylase CobD [Vibrio sp. Of7-15]|uniref:threonine-phosphate decarboxylase CobD n=1 Tax=Vibrio sp. Of7-15 TaxID=2724879 RepID=UPI001EF33F27|nr:threonine-phosphate decarboxylase CobD [Vibrio sp. Of7-15]MCG7499322.1 threonine-phosphate decarboxylase CobD [Vibrio sp. Of7-15]